MRAPLYTGPTVTQALGIDIGGTFIDFVVIDSSGLRLYKFPSTPDAPARGVLDAIQTLLTNGVLRATELSRVAHGSTVATNALLEGTWARTALITTRGFRDVLEIGRQNRSSLYDLDVTRPDPIVPRDLRFESQQRHDADGAVVRPLADEEIRDIAATLRLQGVESVAVVYLFSYLDPSHEKRTGRLLQEATGLPVSLSCDVLPEFREYERTSTTVVCASLRPVIERYIDELACRSSELGIAPQWQIMQSSGAVIGVAQAAREPVRILLSGPAAGVQGARVIGEAVGALDLITMDMGGTSCDVAVVQDGRVGQTTSGAVGGYPVAVRMNEIHTIGAGGGSIAWIDVGGALRVGPRSAGARPGPACYGHGGQLPTVTDAHVVLGHLLPDLPLGGLPRLDAEQARAVLAPLAERLDLSIEATALGVLDVADAAMERAVRVITVERGIDPRRHALLAFGGAGPLHAVSIARRLSIPRVLVPSTAGVLSAMGLLACPAGRDYGRSILRSLDDLDAETLAGLLDEMTAQGERAMAAEGIPPAALCRHVSADLRYRGQSHELNIPLDLLPTDELTQPRVAGWADAFHREHERRFGHAATGEPVELVTLRVRMDMETGFRLAPPAERGEAAAARRVEAWFATTGPVSTAVIDRRGLRAGDRIEGPAILYGPDATLLVPPAIGGTCDALGTLDLEVA